MVLIVGQFALYTVFYVVVSVIVYMALYATCHEGAELVSLQSSMKPQLLVDLRSKDG